MNTPYPHLFAPIKIGPVTLPHRAIMSAHGMGLGAGGPGVSERYHEYLLERARGGAAMIGMESAPIHASTFSRSLVIRLDQDECVPSLRRLADAVHAAGSKLAITLWHGGHKDGALRGPWSVAPSPIPNMAGEVPRALTIAEIREIVAAYGTAAARCRAAGLDCLEVQTATDYLLGSFLSPALNHRRDAYGGSAENRARIVCEVLETVREAAGPDIAVGVRCSSSHDIPGATADYTLDESVAAMQLLDRRGLVDYVSVMAGSGWAEGASIPAMHRPRVMLATEAAAFKRALKVPVFIAGRIRTASEADQLIASGTADVVAMARTWIAEPEWAQKLRSGREAEIRPCLSCNQGCVGAVFRGMPGSCILNPRAGRELEWERSIRKAPASEPNVTVVGGGPAGLEFARLAAEAGYSVTLHEADSALGGQWRLAAMAPQREELALSLRWWQSELARLQVRIHLNSSIDPAQPSQTGRTVWAIGAAPAQTAVWRLRPYLFDGIPGAAQATHGRELLAGGPVAAGAVALIDEEGGWSALSQLEFLLQQPQVTRVELITTEAAFAHTTLSITFETSRLAGLHERVQSGRLIIHAKSSVQSIDNKGFIELSSGETLGPYAQLILATGTAARTWPEDGIAIGDCVAPRGVWSATSDAARLIADWTRRGEEATAVPAARTRSG